MGIEKEHMSNLVITLHSLNEQDECQLFPSKERQHKTLIFLIIFFIVWRRSGRDSSFQVGHFEPYRAFLPGEGHGTLSSSLSFLLSVERDISRVLAVWLLLPEKALSVLMMWRFLTSSSVKIFSELSGNGAL